MARLSIAFTIPDDQLQRVIAAMREHYGPVYETTLVPNGPEGGMMEVPVSRDRTPAELLDDLRGTVVAEIKRIVSVTEAATAARNAKSELDGIVLG